LVKTPSVENIKQSFLDNLFCAMSRITAVATKNDLYAGIVTIQALYPRGYRPLRSVTQSPTRAKEQLEVHQIKRLEPIGACVPDHRVEVFAPRHGSHGLRDLETRRFTHARAFPA
jgi:hypothetical protein